MWMPPSLSSTWPHKVVPFPAPVLQAIQPFWMAL